MALKLERKGYRVKILCTDGYEGYASYRLGERHVISKAETSLVESKNSLIRHYLARFNRRSKRYSKALDMIFHSIYLLFNKNILLSIFI
jgi:insertion element IS1 protein InsB